MAFCYSIGNINFSQAQHAKHHLPVPKIFPGHRNLVECSLFQVIVFPASLQSFMISNYLWGLQECFNPQKQTNKQTKTNPPSVAYWHIYGLEAFILRKWHKVEFKCLVVNQIYLEIDKSKFDQTNGISKLI